MDVIIDTNAVYSDPMMESGDWPQLWKHLSRTKSRLLVPEVVKSEANANHARRCDKLVANLASNAHNLKKLTGIDTVIQLPEAGECAESYTKRWTGLLHSGRVEVLPQPENAMTELIDRATKRIPPFDQNANGFRDSLIWLSIRLHMSSTRDEVAFISNDKAFSSEAGALHPELEREIGTGRLLFYRNSGDFLIHRGGPSGEIPSP